VGLGAVIFSGIFSRDATEFPVFLHYYRRWVRH
jgi:hypothetical protein